MITKVLSLCEHFDVFSEGSSIYWVFTKGQALFKALYQSNPHSHSVMPIVQPRKLRSQSLSNWSKVIVLGRGVARIPTQAVSFSTTSCSICITGVHYDDAHTAAGLALPTGNYPWRWSRKDWVCVRGVGAGGMTIAMERYISQVTPEGNRNAFQQIRGLSHISPRYIWSFCFDGDSNGFCCAFCRSS